MSNRLLKNADTFAEAIRTAGDRAAAGMLRAGIAVYYMDESLSDGTRQKVEIGDGDDIVLETLPSGSL